jgi:hypothetical protein
MYYSSLCLLIPVLFLELSNFLFYSLLSLSLFSFIYHNNNNRVTKILDYTNIVNISANFCLDFPYSFLYILLFLIEEGLFETHYSKNIIYLLAYSKVFYIKNVNPWFFMSLFVYCQATYFKRFHCIERWLWHFGQAMYLYVILFTMYPSRNLINFWWLIHILD